MYCPSRFDELDLTRSIPHFCSTPHISYYLPHPLFYCPIFACSLLVLRLAFLAHTLYFSTDAAQTQHSTAQLHQQLHQKQPHPALSSELLCIGFYWDLGQPMTAGRSLQLPSALRINRNPQGDPPTSTSYGAGGTNASA